MKVERDWPEHKDEKAVPRFLSSKSKMPPIVCRDSPVKPGLIESVRVRSGRIHSGKCRRDNWPQEMEAKTKCLAIYNQPRLSTAKQISFLFLRSKCFQAWILVYAKRGISKIKWRYPGSFSGAVLNEVFIHILLTFSYTFFTNLFERIWFLVKTSLLSRFSRRQS